MSTLPRVLILNATCLDVLDACPDKIRADGIDLVADRSLLSVSAENFQSLIGDAQGLILPAPFRTFPHARQMDELPNLRILSIAANGFDWLDIGAATQRGIVVTNAPALEGVEVVADMTWALLLTVARQIPAHHDAMIHRQNVRGTGVSVCGKTLGIVGLGNIGKATARRAKGFDMKILAAAPRPDRDFAREHGITIVPLHELLQQSDFVSLHVRLTAETKNLIGARELALMKPSAILINTARDQLVNAEALTRAILEKRLAGAGLDDPPMPGHEGILNHPSVVFTPHLGNRAIEGMLAVFQLAVDNAAAVLRGERPTYVLNPECRKSC